jgi:uncharacterized protein YwqG
MSICVNDITKKYTGKELNPKGLGYSASGEESGTLMTGKDGNLYQVMGTDLNKKWCKFNIKKETEFDFTRLPKEFFKDAYFPNMSETHIDIQDETGLEEKFGGNKPFFLKSEKWPIDPNGNAMHFICQFIDPSKNDNILVRLFISLEEEDIIQHYHLSSIELTEENLANQKKIKSNSIFPAYKIMSWSKKKELVSFNYISKKFGLTDYMEKTYNKLYDDYYKSDILPSFGIKLYGTPSYCQIPDDKKTDINFIQLSEERFLNYGWGDSGIAHIYPNGEFYYDCF